MRVLHIVPDSVADPKHFYLGSTKDIRGRTEYFESREILFDEMLAKDRSDTLLVDQLKGLNLDRYTSVLFEYPIYPASLRLLSEGFPHLRLLTRSHNAEFYHRLHTMLAHIQNMKHFHHSDPGIIVRTAFRSLFRLRQDYLCARRSDYLLCITQWEQENYWRYLAKNSKVACVPYYLPEMYAHLPCREAEKKCQCVCLMSTGLNCFLINAANNFIRLVEALKQTCAEWSFWLTGDFTTNRSLLRHPERISFTGLLDNPFTMLAESRAVALLSDYGFGFKTKLLDAIFHKCYVFVTQGLYRRLPVEIKPYCIVVGLNSVESFKNALEESMRPYPEGNPNDEFRTQAFAALDALLF